MARTSNAGPGLTPAAHHILLSLLRGELHGYAIMQAVEELSDGSMRLGPGSLYTTLPRLLDEGLVEESEARPDDKDERRRYYRLTGTGHLERFLSEQVKSIGGIQRTHSIIALSSAKETREIDTTVPGTGQ
jgi:DNA-binding PadR family transcriptional regulator